MPDATNEQIAMATTAVYDDVTLRDRDTGRKPSRRGLAIRLSVVLVLIALIGGGLWFFNEFRKQAISDSFAGNVPPPTAVAALPAEVGPLPHYLSGVGSLQAIRQVDVSPEVEGRVVEILFEPGQAVKKGRPLVQLNDAPERADLASFEAQLKLARSDLERTQRLARNDFATVASLDENQARVEQAEAGIAKSKALIEQKLVTAPFDGELGIRQVEYGQQVTPQTTLVTLTDIDRLYVNLTVPEQSRALLEVGQTVEFTVDAYPGRVFEARLLTIEPQIDAGTRAIRLQAKMNNRERLLLPGMYANARVVLPPQPDAVTVPETAVARTLYGDSVFIVREDGAGPGGEPVAKAVQTFVRTGDAIDGRVAIVEGVAPGDLVVSSGQLKLQNGAAVRVVESDPLQPPAQAPVE